MSPIIQLLYRVGRTLRSVVLSGEYHSLPSDVLIRLWQDSIRAWHPVIELRIDVLISDTVPAVVGERSAPQ